MVLVYTYNSQVHKNKEINDLNISYYRESIHRAKELGYRVEMYSDSSLFSKEVDKLHLIKGYKTLLWDSYKFIPLSKRDDNFILIDGDVFLYKPIELDPSCDFTADCIEEGNWNLLYNNTVKQLTELGVQTIIPEWDGRFLKVVSCGVLHFKNPVFRMVYTSLWNKLYSFIEDNSPVLDLYSCTPVAAQYLLTLLAKTHNIKYELLNERLGYPGKFYVHHAGKDKFKGVGINKGSII